MMTARGKIQRVRVAEIGVIGRNTQGVRIMSLDDEDTLAAVVRVPKEEADDEVGSALSPSAGPATLAEDATDTGESDGTEKS